MTKKQETQEAGISFHYQKTGIGQINITPEMVVCVYSGTPNRCMCGCSGKYYYTSWNREYSNKRRGYDITDDEINDKMVRRVLKIFEKFVEESGGDYTQVEGIDDYIFTIETSPTRQYTIYLKQSGD